MPRADSALSGASESCGGRAPAKIGAVTGQAVAWRTDPTLITEERTVDGRARALMLSFALGAACASAAPRSHEPAWLNALIADLERQPVANPPALIARYEYKGQTVYYLPPRCCDIPSTVYSATGTVLCAADGGMTGAGDGRCPDFYAERKDEAIIWRDTRGAR